MSSPARKQLLFFISGVAVLIIVLVVWWRIDRANEQARKMSEALELNNRGVAYMEQFKFKEAADEFAKVVEVAPDWTPGQINLAIALYNKGGSDIAKAGSAEKSNDNIQRAIEIFRQVLTKEPDNPHAHFCLGYLLLYQSKMEDAIKHFEAVIRVDPDDAGALYELAYCLSQLDRDQQQPRIIELCEKALQSNPYLNAAAALLQDSIRGTDPVRANKLLDDAERLRSAWHYAEFDQKYADQGTKYAQVIGRPNLPKRSIPDSPVPVFEPWDKFQVKLAPGARWAKGEDFGSGPLGDLRRAVRKRFGATIVRLDFNRDGRPDFFLLGAVVENGQVRDLLLRNDGGGLFTDVTAEAGLSGGRPSLGCCVGDFDNDGYPDLFISGAGAQKLFRNQGDGKFEDVSAKAGLDKLTDVCLGCLWVDLEQDGDLDLLVARYADTPENAIAAMNGGKPAQGGLAVFVNIGAANPTQGGRPRPGLEVAFKRYSDMEKSLGFSGSAVAFAATDADDDLDLDAVILEDHAPAMLAINDRLLRYRKSSLNAAAEGRAWNGVLVLDLDQDEKSDLLLLANGQRPEVLLNRAKPGKDKASLYELGATNSPPLRQAQVVDIDMDGWPDVIGLSEAGKVVLLINTRDGKLTVAPDALGLDREWGDDLIGISVGDFDGDGNPDFLTWSESNGLQVRRSRGNTHHSVKVRLVGRRDKANPPVERSNNDGFGAHVIVQSGRQWAHAENTTLSAGLGQSWLPLEMGLGKASLNDAIVRLRWPDQVIQAEILGLPDTSSEPKLTKTNENIWQIEEKNRKGVSCPILFTWDGEKFVYVTDFLGAGSVGEMQPEGGTRPPRPEESVKIESNQLKPRDGYFTLKVAEPMDEVTYLDSLRLQVVDVPPGVDVFPDERFATAGAPTQELLFFRERFFPAKARDQKGNDITSVVRHRDKKMTGGFATSYWIGYAEEHWVELDFGEQLKNIGAKDKLYLVLAGWTDYPYPESIFAAAQAGVPMIPPVLEKLGPDGKWIAIHDLGFPAGLPRVMTKEVTGLLAGFGGKLRIRTNMQIYWDQIFLAPIASGERKLSDLGVASASLAARGFMREIHPDKSPLVEYDPERLEAVPVNPWKGRLTRLGDVTELLKSTDDRHVIIGPGDELTVRFDARNLPPLSAGWSRQFVLRTWGYCKDSAPFTATGLDVNPLPFRGMKQFPPGQDEKYPHPNDLRDWHTRRPN